MTRRTLELTGEIDQSDPVGYLVFTAGGDLDFRVFTDLFEAENYASDQQEEAEADGWPIYPLFAGHALDHQGAVGEVINKPQRPDRSHTPNVISVAKSN